MPPIERMRSGSRIWARSKFTLGEAVSLSLKTGRLLLQKHPVLRLCKPLVPNDSLLVRAARIFDRTYVDVARTRNEFVPGVAAVESPEMRPQDENARGSSSCVSAQLK
jgi:hypothetical protein